MKIEKITPFMVDRFLLVRVYTDEGIVGNGEAGLWAHHPMVYAAIQELSEYYVGKDPRQIEHHFQVVSRSTHFMGAVQSAAISAIDIALWDILAKSVNLPVYQLLGGKCRDKVKVFANVGGATVDECVQSAVKGVEQGYVSLRLAGFWPGCEKLTATQEVTQIAERIKQVREAIGTRFELAVGDRLAGGGHDESRLQRAQVDMLAGVHLLDSYAANDSISRTWTGPSILRGLRGTQGVRIACSAI